MDLPLRVLQLRGLVTVRVPPAKRGGLHWGIFGGSGGGLAAAEADLGGELLGLELAEKASAIPPVVSAGIFGLGRHGNLWRGGSSPKQL